MTDPRSLNDKLDEILGCLDIQVTHRPGYPSIATITGKADAKQALVAFIEEAQTVAYKKGYIDKGISDLTKEKS